jgi:hypothetical protein
MRFPDVHQQIRRAKHIHCSGMTRINAIGIKPEQMS